MLFYIPTEGVVMVFLEPNVVLLVTACFAQIVCILMIRRPCDAQRFALELLVRDASSTVMKEMQIVRSIVESTAPAHVIGHMVRMMSKPFKERGYAMTLPHVTVCFLKITLQNQQSNDTDLEAYRNVHGVHTSIEETLNSFPKAIKIKTVGSMLMVAGPLLPKSTTDDVVSATEDIVTFARRAIDNHHDRGDQLGLNLRCGVHSGALQAAILGTNRLTYDIFGDTVNTASRCASTCPTGKVQMTQGVYDLVKNTQSVPEGSFSTQQMKGVGEVSVFIC
jgi:class 3 adenylate cyclase